MAAAEHFDISEKHREESEKAYSYFIKLQAELDRAREENEKLEKKAQKTADNAPTYAMLAIIFRIAFALALVIVAVLTLAKKTLGLTTLIGMVVALTLLAGSIGAEFITVDAERKIYEYNHEIRKNRLALLKLKNRH